jgi:23S rRNA pseudouridine2605 synthase
LKKSPRPSSPSLPGQTPPKRPLLSGLLKPSAPPRPSPKSAPVPAASPPGVAHPRGERLQKLLAAAGLGSRREIESWIEAGRVTLSGRAAKLGDRALPTDEIAVDGKVVSLSKALAPRVLLYHKPVGELVTRSDPEGRPTVFARLPPGRWVAVGRLDINSSGLLLLTDSGELANKLMHPRYEVEREYAVRVHGALGAKELEKLRHGVQLEDGLAAFSRIELSDQRDEVRSSNRWYRVALREGRNREVRRLFEAIGAKVSRLIRIRYASIELPRELPAGQWLELDSRQVQGLSGT